MRLPLSHRQRAPDNSPGLQPWGTSAINRISEPLKGATELHKQNLCRPIRGFRKNVFRVPTQGWKPWATLCGPFRGQENAPEFPDTLELAQLCLQRFGLGAQTGFDCASVREDARLSRNVSTVAPEFLDTFKQAPPWHPINSRTVSPRRGDSGYPSRSISVAAFLPHAPITPPPGWAALPQRYRPSMGVR